MTATQTSHFGPLVSLHEGFFERFLFLLPSVQRVISSFETKNVVFVGHSMGGAVAILMALEYRDKLKVNCFTLAAPIIGDERFRNMQFYFIVFYKKTFILGFLSNRPNFTSLND